jgi:tRNA threonylcarbamoyladenosine biosynthesis protein TsaB
MKLLAIDTSTLTAGVAVWDGAPRAARRQRVTTHSDALLLLVEEALAEAGLRAAELDGIACGAGPGSFTGLRIGLATAKGLCFALDKPLVLISSLAALAARAPAGERVCATLDAHKGEVYAGLFTVEADGVRAEEPERVLPPAELARALAAAPPRWIVGEGAHRYAELAAIVPLLDGDPAPDPSDVARLAAPRFAAGQVDELARSAPGYIRPSEAELVQQKKRG